MDNENVDAQEDTVEQEEQVVEETKEDESQDEPTEESITLSKADYKSLKRKAIAYDSNKSKPKVETKEVETSDVSSERFERLELRADGYSSDEIDEIMELGGSKVLKTKIVQSAIKAMRQEKKSKDASESPDSKSPVYKKFTQDDMNKMSSKELEKILPHD